jgi:hypothetical protein
MVGSPVVGRTFEHPSKDLFYWLTGWSGDLVEVTRPGAPERKLVGRASDFRRYGEAVEAEVNPTLARLPPEDMHAARVRLCARVDREWDTLGIMEEQLRRRRDG